MWLRIDFKDGDSKLFDIPLRDLDQFIDLIEKKQIINADRLLMIFPHGTPQKLSALQLKDMNPLYSICKQEFINSGEIKSFGVVDESSNVWKKICAPALGETSIITPDKKLELP